MSPAGVDDQRKICLIMSIAAIAASICVSSEETKQVSSKRRRVSTTISRPLRMGITFENVPAIYTQKKFANAFRMSREDSLIS